jgi:hypothetical protein
MKFSVELLVRNMTALGPPDVVGLSLLLKKFDGVWHFLLTL